MTSLATRILGTADDPEETPMTVPQRRIPAVPGADGIPWYAGVPGLDPDCRVADARFAARCSAMACAALVFGVDAGRAAALRSSQHSPAGKAYAWLLHQADEGEIRVRILALRLAAEQIRAGRHAVSADDFVRAARDLYLGVS